jgi:hypothetical protein
MDLLGYIYFFIGIPVGFTFVAYSLYRWITN